MKPVSKPISETCINCYKTETETEKNFKPVLTPKPKLEKNMDTDIIVL